MATSRDLSPSFSRMEEPFRLHQGCSPQLSVKDERTLAIVPLMVAINRASPMYEIGKALGRSVDRLSRTRDDGFQLSTASRRWRDEPGTVVPRHTAHQWWV